MDRENRLTTGLSAEILPMIIELNKNLVACRRSVFERGVTFRQARFLACLAEVDHAPTLTEMTELHDAGSTQGCRQVTYRLEREGLIEVTSDEKDRRTVRFLITERGRRVGEAYLMFVDRMSDKIEESLTETELEATVKALGALLTLSEVSSMKAIAGGFDDTMNDKVR